MALGNGADHLSELTGGFLIQPLHVEMNPACAATPYSRLPISEREG